MTLRSTKPETLPPWPSAEKAQLNSTPSAPRSPLPTHCSLPAQPAPAAPAQPHWSSHHSCSYWLHTPFLHRMGSGAPEHVTLLALPPRTGCWAFTPSGPQSCQWNKACQVQNGCLKQLRHTPNCPLSTLCPFLFSQH